MKKYEFIRRHILLDRKDKNFRILRDEPFEETGSKFEEALVKLTSRINEVEGTERLVPNDGFPIHIETSDDKAMYLANYFMVGLLYIDNCKENEGENNRISFVEFLNSEEDCEEKELYQGIYTDERLMYPKGFTTYRMECEKDNFNYIFYTEGGKDKGELDNYLYYDGILFRNDKISN